jgi:capsular polysaccharide transport system permease protein
MSRAGSLAPAGGFVDGLITQQAVLRALILRELQSRFGRDNIGYLWVIGEPMMLASVISLLHFVVDPHSNPGMGPFPFTLLGYALFIIFRNTFNRSEGMLQGSSNLFYHAQVSPFDVVLAKILVEALACLSALVILMTVGIMLGIAQLPARPLYVAYGAIGITALTFGMTLILAAATYKSHVLGRFVHPFSYFMFPLSGAFVTMDFLPPWAQRIMAWNPFMTVFETARYGMFRNASGNYIYPEFIIATCAVLLYGGLIAIRRVRADIHVR